MDSRPGAPEDLSCTATGGAAALRGGAAAGPHCPLNTHRARPGDGGPVHHQVPHAAMVGQRPSLCVRGPWGHKGRWGTGWNRGQCPTSSAPSPKTCLPGCPIPEGGVEAEGSKHLILQGPLPPPGRGHTHRAGPQGAEGPGRPLRPLPPWGLGCRWSVCPPSAGGYSRLWSLRAQGPCNWAGRGLGCLPRGSHWAVRGCPSWALPQAQRRGVGARPWEGGPGSPASRCHCPSHRAAGHVTHVENSPPPSSARSRTWGGAGESGERP